MRKFPVSVLNELYLDSSVAAELPNDIVYDLELIYKAKSHEDKQYELVFKDLSSGKFFHAYYCKATSSFMNFDGIFVICNEVKPVAKVITVFEEVR